MSFIPKPHEIYKHFKGNLYQVTAIAEHTETGEQLVVYQALYGDFLTYARPLAMFVSRVDREKYPDAVQEFRFELQGPEAERQRAESQEAPEEGASRRQAGNSYEAVSRLESGSQMGAGIHGGISGQSAPDAETTAADQALSIHGGTSGQSAPDVGLTAEDQALSIHGGTSVQPVSDIRLNAAEQKNVAQNEEDEISIDPLVLEFLDADSYGEQLNILAALHHRITDEMITTMAIASDIEINEGDIEERYEALKTCLLTLERYECNRLR